MKVILTLLLVGFIATAQTPLDCKGQDCKVQVLITEENFKDALYYTPEEWLTKDKTTVDTTKAARYAAWIKAVDNASKIVPVPQTKEELEAEKLIAWESLNLVNAKLEAFEPTKAELEAARLRLEAELVVVNDKLAVIAAKK